MAVVAEEWYGHGDPPFQYVRDRLRPVAQRRRQASHGVRELCRSVFMPQGFPESVSPDYVEYQAWDSVQACESTQAAAAAAQPAHRQPLLCAVCSCSPNRRCSRRRRRRRRHCCL